MSSISIKFNLVYTNVEELKECGHNVYNIRMQIQDVRSNISNIDSSMNSVRKSLGNIDELLERDEKSLKLFATNLGEIAKLYENTEKDIVAGEKAIQNSDIKNKIQYISINSAADSSDPLSAIGRLIRGLIDFYGSKQKGQSNVDVIIKCIAHVIISIAGKSIAAAIIAAVGSIAGTAIAPGPGTIVGAAIGAAIGFAIGWVINELFVKAYDNYSEKSKNVGPSMEGVPAGAVVPLF